MTTPAGVTRRTMMAWVYDSVAAICMATAAVALVWRAPAIIRAWRGPEDR